MAISGRLVTMARKMSPPMASPSPRRVESTSVVRESFTPASQTAVTEARNTASATGKDSIGNMVLRCGPIRGGFAAHEPFLVHVELQQFALQGAVVERVDLAGAQA